MNDRTGELIKAFEYGVDYGLLLAEQERDSEDLFDAIGCMVVAAKFGVPSAPAQRRQPRSRIWRETMNNSVIKFICLVLKKQENNA